MAAYTITAAEVTKSTSAQTAEGTAGAAITAGQALYLDSTTSTLKLAQSDGTSAEATVVGVALNSAASGQIVVYQFAGDLTLDTAALTNAAKGDIVTLGAIAGGLYPNEDILTTEYVSVIGYMVTSNPGLLRLSIINTGVTHV